jgi:hypothetical protein
MLPCGGQKGLNNILYSKKLIFQKKVSVGDFLGVNQNE